MGSALRGCRTGKVTDGALCFFIGLLSQQPRCAANLENLLIDYFEVQVKGGAVC